MLRLWVRESNNEKTKGEKQKLVCVCDAFALAWNLKERNIARPDTSLNWVQN